MLEITISARKLLAIPAAQLQLISSTPEVTITSAARSRVIRCSLTTGRDLAQQLINMGCSLEALIDPLLNGTSARVSPKKQPRPTTTHKPKKIKLTAAQSDFRNALIAVATQQLSLPDIATLLTAAEPTVEEAQKYIGLLASCAHLNPRAVKSITKKLWKLYPQLNSEQLNSEELNSEQLNSEQLNSEELNSEELNSEELNSEQLNSEQLNSEQLNSEELNSEALPLDEGDEGDEGADDLPRCDEESCTEPPEGFWDAHHDEDEDEEDEDEDEEGYGKASWTSHLTRFRAGKKINNFEVTVVGTALHVLNMQYNPSSPSGEAIDALLTSLEEVARGAVHFNVLSPHHATGFKVFDQDTAEEMYKKLQETADYIAPLPGNVINLLAVLKDLLNCHHLD